MSKLTKYGYAYLELIKDNPIKIAHELGFTKLIGLHNDWIKKFIFSKEDYLLQGSRGSYKTTCLIVALSILVIVTPNDNILVMRKTDGDIKDIIRAVTSALQHPLFIDMAYQFYGKELKVDATQTSIKTNLVTFDRGTPQLTGCGISGSLTGKHYERIFTDDICTIKDRVSGAERERTKLIYQEIQNLKNRGGIIGNTGTPWHKEDVFNLMPPAEKHDVYSLGFISQDEIKQIRSRMTPSLFAANYELKHIADENALFKNPSYTSEGIDNGICHIDAGYGGEDYTAFTIMKKTDDGFVAFGKMWQKHVDNCLEEIFLLREKYLSGSFSIENNGDKGYLCKEIEQKALEFHNRGLIASKQVTVNSYYERMNKDVKIKTYLYTYWNDIKWLEDTDPEYMSQILDYSENAEHDDAPDSASSCLRRLIDGGKVKAVSSLWD